MTDLDLFQEIEVEKPADLIIKQIRQLISSGRLKPGLRLPSERVLAERFGVGRGHIREALKKLEFYGILKTQPQKGTIVASLGVKALEGLISNLLATDTRDFESLMEIRALLEVHAARLAAKRAGQAEIEEINYAFEDFRRKVEQGQSGLEEDHLFHLKIAEESKNSVLRSLIGLITPDIIAMTRERQDRHAERQQTTVKEHENILEGIRSRDPDRAARAMSEHMDMAHKRRKV
ncbi:MAG: FadR family transcriptional regulator [Spirochaetaceae bacterium]|nr:MAG: FadR family transcriptional regulator [Spirochaetaceae bacterium]